MRNDTHDDTTRQRTEEPSWLTVLRGIGRILVKSMELSTMIILAVLALLNRKNLVMVSIIVIAGIYLWNKPLFAQIWNFAIYIGIILFILPRIFGRK